MINFCHHLGVLTFQSSILSILPCIYITLFIFLCNFSNEFLAFNFIASATPCLKCSVKFLEILGENMQQQSNQSSTECRATWETVLINKSLEYSFAQTVVFQEKYKTDNPFCQGHYKFLTTIPLLANKTFSFFIQNALFILLYMSVQPRGSRITYVLLL